MLDWIYIFKLLLKMLEIIEMGIVFMVIVFLFSLFLGVFVVWNILLYLVLYYCICNVFNLMCVLLELVWVLVFVLVVGLGFLFGVMVFIFVIIGFLGKFLVESIEVVDVNGVIGVKFMGVGWL